MADYSLIIDGNSVTTKETFEVLNPATEEVIANCPMASESNVDDAVSAAKRHSFLGAVQQMMSEKKRSRSLRRYWKRTVRSLPDFLLWKLANR